jgi:hypothetical protein
MGAPPADLNQYASYETILQTPQTVVKAVLPATVTCPLCGSKSLTIYKEPNDREGYWYVCKGCSFRGDSFELHQKINGIPDLGFAIRDVADQDLLSISSTELTDRMIDEHCGYYPDRRHRTNNFWESSREEIKDINQDWLQLLSKNHLWGGWQAGGWHEQLGRFIGAASRDQVRNGVDHKLPDDSYQKVLVMPYYDVSGRISSFLYVGQSGSIRKGIRKTGGSGLMMLDTVRPYENTVYAFGDPFAGIQLQRRHLVNEDDPLPMVVWNDDTKEAWRSINAQRVILWDFELGERLFMQARRHKQAYITQHIPTKDGDTLMRGYNFFRKMPVAYHIGRMGERARPYLEVFHEWLLSVSYWRANKCLNAMSLGEEEKDELLRQSTKRQRQQLTELFGQYSPEREVRIDDFTVIETEDGWFVQQKNRPRVSDAILRLQQTIFNPQNSETYFSGTVTFKRKDFPFFERKAVVERATSKWMENFLLRQPNGGMPDISKRYSNKLISIALRFHQPEHVEGATSVGWHAGTESFVFPNFVIHEGVIDTERNLLVTDLEEAPARDLKPPVPLGKIGSLGMLIEDSEANAAIWAGLAAVVSNIAAPAYNMPNFPVGMVGGPGSTAHTVGRQIAKSLGMRHSILTDARRKDYKRLTQDVCRHAYPTLVEIDYNARNALSLFSANVHLNLMTLLSEKEAAALQIGDAWIFIRSPQIYARYGSNRDLRNILQILVMLQRNRMELTGENHLILQILELMKLWLVETEGSKIEKVLDHAASIIQVPNTPPIEERALNLVFQMIESGRLGFTRVEFYDDIQQHRAINTKFRKSVLLDDEAGHCFIPHGIVMALLRSDKLPIPDLSISTRALNARNALDLTDRELDGWVMKSAFFEEQHKSWKKRLGT